MSKFKVTFLPDKRTGYAERNYNLLRLADNTGIELEAACGGLGICGKCRIKVLDGKVSPLSEEELKLLTDSEITQNIRLACRTRVLGPLEITLCGDSVRKKSRIVEDGYSVSDIPYNPLIKKKYLELSKLSRSGASFAEEIEKALCVRFCKDFPLHLLSQLALTLKEKNEGVTAVIHHDEVIGIEPGDTGDKSYGIAVDIGTTTVVVSLVNLKDAHEIGVASVLNPQTKYGLDVLSRIVYSNESQESLISLQNLIISAINGMIERLCAQFCIDRESIYEVVVSGNPTMLHLFLGISPYSIGRSPYKVVFRKGLTVKAHELGMSISNFGMVYCLPSVSGYIGADIVAGAIATDFYKERVPSLFIDLGTNGEIVLHHKSKTIACSCAAGPTWEGMNISCGMIASEGAIEMVELTDGSVKFQAMGDKAPAGICGSGIIDTVAELIKSGFVDSSGRLRKVEENSALTKRLLNENEELRFVLVEASLSANGKEISISQRDIRQVQLAKGAISSGIKVLLDEAGIGWKNISRVFVAGAFGKHLRIESLKRIGIIPEEARDKVLFVGNTSKEGAMLCLLSLEKRKEAEEISENIQYIELSTYPEYEKLFIKELAFP